MGDDVPVKKERTKKDRARWMMEVWNETAGAAGCVKSRIDQTIDDLSDELNRAYERWFKTDDAWRAYCKLVAQSAFLTGQAHTPDRDQPWRANLSFVLKKKSHTKIVEQAYGGPERTKPRPINY